MRIKNQIKLQSRRGSALLIVLGMLSFMVVSAVAFSAWMRASRLPNSYLRRSSASRMLAKAAMAEAIDDLDSAIGNNPHPGFGARKRRQKNSGDTSNLQNRNTWLHRIFIGTNDMNNVNNNLVETDETVSTLCLEALAYIPPALVNEARYYSRRSTAGRWHTLDYDCGRYAYCAIDVSDYFDVNALTANAGRSSAANGRITLAHLFENQNHTSYDKQPSEWETFMKQYAREKSPIEASLKGGKWVSETKVPFISVADLNLAMADYGTGCGFESPFCKYLQNSAASFYSGIGANTADGDRIQRMTFVTDGLYPSAGGSTANDDYDLADAQYQPFEKSLLEKKNATVGSVWQPTSKGGSRLLDKLSQMDMVMLYDYLDCNNVPISLSLPQVERTPMIAAFEPSFSGSELAVTSTKDPADPLEEAKKAGGDTAEVTQTCTYKFDQQKFTQGMKAGTIKALVAYPFRRGIDLDDPDTFKIDGHISFFFTSGDMTFRTCDDDRLHLKQSGDKLEPANPCDGVFTVQIPQQKVNVVSVPKKENEALIEVNLTARSAAADVATTVGNRSLLTVKKKFKYKKNEEGNLVPDGDPEITSATCDIPALTAAGELDSEFTENKLIHWIEKGTKTLSFRMAICLRITNGDGETVDLVPASSGDDVNVRKNSVDNANSMGSRGSKLFGPNYPVMRFDSSQTFVFGLESFESAKAGVAVDFSPKAVMCPDPRWNWAPEHWFECTSASKDSWLQNCGRDQDGRDHDIFMSTSDSGYLQSIYELAFLPRLTELQGDGDALRGKIESPDDGRKAWATTLGGTMNNSLFWRTYNPYKRQNFTNAKTGKNYDDFEGIGFISEGGGVKINPYSTDTNVVMAAFANTPCDWWCASTNTQDGVQDTVRLDAEKFNKNYAFNEMNSNAKFMWKDLKQIASKFMGEMCKSRTETDLELEDWEDVYDELDWDGENNDICGVDFSGTDELFDVDRKFLYGYWRECFAPRQQLFMVFVRAEPVMMGGGSIGQTPPQLGARAMALVWRDPNKTADDKTPHRTRMLFYRQFE